MFNDMLPAKSLIDFLCVQSSKISPISSINITEPAVLKSRLKSETVIAVASRTDTSSLRFDRHFNAFQTYRAAFTLKIAIRIYRGIKKLRT